MSEIVGRLNRTIDARGPDSLWVESRDALVAAYGAIADLHERLATKEAELASRASVPDAALAAHLVLDPEKVRQVIAPLFNNDADGSWGPFSPEDMATRALCQAAKRGELSA